MSLELYVNFENISWYKKNKEFLISQIKMKKNYAGMYEGAFWLREGAEGDRGKSDCPYDVRIFFEEENIYLDIMSNSKAIVQDLGGFLDEIRSQTSAKVQDDDGELSDW